MVLIPLLLVGNSLVLLRAIHRDANFVLRREAALVESALAPFLVELFRDPDRLRERLTKLRQSAPEIVNLSLVIPEAPGAFSVLASTSVDPAPDALSPLNAIVLTTGESHAALVRDPGEGANVWSVVAPVRDGERIAALMHVKISTADVTAILKRTTRDSFLILIATILVALLLLVNHARFFEYAQIARKLRELNQMKDDFISIASHELRTPLTTIRGFTHLLKEALREAQVTVGQREVGMVLREVNRLSDLVEDLLNVSRIEQGRIQFELQPVSLKTTLRVVTENFRSQASSKGLTLTYAEPAADLAVFADPKRLTEVFVNLVGNAVKYTQQGSVTIRHEVAGERVKTLIQDTGVGMSPEEREHLFEKFYRIRETQTRDITGTGLGLWIAQQIIERLGGKIYVDSIKGQGSQFTVLLPLLTRADGPAPSTQAGRAGGAPERAGGLTNA